MNEGARAFNLNSFRSPLFMVTITILSNVSKRAHLYDALDLFDLPRVPSLLASLHATEPAVRAMTSDLDTPDPSAPHRSSITDP